MHDLSKLKRAALERQDATLALGLIPDVAVLLVHSDHDPGVLRAAHDGRENGPGSVIPSEASLAPLRLHPLRPP